MIKVTVLMGGISSEREVSISSGKAVSEALKKAGYDVDEIQITDELLNPEKINTPVSPIKIPKRAPSTAPKIEIDLRFGSTFSSITFGGSRYEKT